MAAFLYNTYPIHPFKNSFEHFKKRRTFAAVKNPSLAFQGPRVCFKQINLFHLNLTNRFANKNI